MCISSLWVVPNGRVVMCGWSGGRCSVLVLRVKNTEIKCCCSCCYLYDDHMGTLRGGYAASLLQPSRRRVRWYHLQLHNQVVVVDHTRVQGSALPGHHLLLKRNVMCHYILSSTISYIYLYSHCSSHQSVSYFLLYTLIIQLKYCKYN